MNKLTYQIVIWQVARLIVLDQIRKEATDEEDKQLTESIRLHGVLQPLGVRPEKEGPGGKVIWGHRRLRCAIAAGLTELPCVVLDKDMTEGEYLALQMIENVQRADLNPFDMHVGCVRLLEANPGWQLKDLAKALAMDPSSVTRWLSPSRCSQAWRDALKAGKIGISDCYAASKLLPDEQEGLLALKLSGASRDKLEETVRKARKPPATTEKFSSVKLALANGITVTVKGGEINGDLLAECLTQAREAVIKANKEHVGVKALVRVLADKAKAGA